jgi:chromosome segregation ATPase
MKGEDPEYIKTLLEAIDSQLHLLKPK